MSLPLPASRPLANFQKQGYARIHRGEEHEHDIALVHAHEEDAGHVAGIQAGRAPLLDTTPHASPSGSRTSASLDMDELVARQDGRTPTPYFALVPLMASRMAEGVVYAFIMPYVNEMIFDLGVPEADVGIWSAAVESALMLTEAIAAPLFAPIGNRYGRKIPMMACIGLLGVGAMSLGLVKSVWGLVLVRGSLGMLAGACVLARTVCIEICDDSNRSHAFALFSPAFSIGVAIGPMLGGTFANPVPHLLDISWSIFVHWPYLLPSILAGVFGLVACVLILMFLPETLPRSLRRLRERRLARDAEARQDGTDAAMRMVSVTAPVPDVSAYEQVRPDETDALAHAHEQDHEGVFGDAARLKRGSYCGSMSSFVGGNENVNGNENENENANGSECGTTSSKSSDSQWDENQGGWVRLAGHKPFQIMAAMYMTIGATQTTFEAVVPLYAFTPVELGGLGLEITTIGAVLALSAVLGISMSVLLFPALHARVPYSVLLMACIAAHLGSILVLPLIRTTPPVSDSSTGGRRSMHRPGKRSERGIDLAAGTMLALHVVLRRLGDFSFTLLDTHVIHTLPSRAYLATAMSAAFSSSAIGRTLGPIVVSLGFTYSARSPAGSWGRWVVWIVWSALVLPSATCAWFVREGRKRRTTD